VSIYVLERDDSEARANLQDEHLDAHRSTVGVFASVTIREFETESKL
jgi:hypothetical protein